MNIKRIYGALLTALGICSLVYAIASLVNSSGLSKILALTIFGILGLTFLISGISLVKKIKDETQ
jgi:uncharacterized membrane protein